MVQAKISSNKKYYFINKRILVDKRYFKNLSTILIWKNVLA